MKKKLLFVINSLGCGGAEKSLVSLLSLIDYDKYDIDLQMFQFGGMFESLLFAVGAGDSIAKTGLCCLLQYADI